MDIRLDSSGGWVTDKAFTRAGRRDGLYGLAGFSCASESKEDWAWAATTKKSKFGRSVSRIDLFWLVQPGGGRFDLLIDDAVTATVSTSGISSDLGVKSIRVPDGPHTVEIRPKGDGEVRFFGMTFERDAPGVIVDSLGIRGARASVILKWNPAIWAAQLKKRRPDLVLLAYGTNESGDTHQPIEKYERVLSKVLARVKGASPQASCVLIGPTDRPAKLGRQWVPRPRVTQVIRTQRRVAGRFGCGFWDARDSMGGEMSITRWRAANPPLASKDHVHLTTRGYYALADDFQKALLYGWRYKRP
jgi:lysophospholipase L1-like esterase